MTTASANVRANSVLQKSFHHFAKDTHSLTAILNMRIVAHFMPEQMPEQHPEHPEQPEQEAGYWCFDVQNQHKRPTLNAQGRPGTTTGCAH